MNVTTSKHSMFITFVCVVIAVIFFPLRMDDCFASDVETIPSEASVPETMTVPKLLTLSQAVMCEGIKELIPQNPSIVFSVSTGKVFCFTSFNPVPERTHIYHTWYRMDKKNQNVKLTLNIPAWSVYSTIQLREATDVGPWRVEISDSKGNIIEILRFSITE